MFFDAGSRLGPVALHAVRSGAGLHHQHGAEYFFIGNGVIAAYIIKNGGGNEQATTDSQ